jgi:putative oxygen-independent coproporphyrinogen III oxidase
MAFGVYVHIPFCATRCDYCDFATWTDRGHLIDEYVDACVADVTRRARTGIPPVTSVFFGGGTPSLMQASQLVRILDAVPRTADAEVTVECNPDSVDLAKLRAYRAAGVNRLSFGVQSTRAHVLAALGRTHDRANVTRAVKWARDAGFERFNLDIIYGTAGESLADWEATLADVLELEPTHVSAYALTVEPATPLGQRVAAGTQSPPDDDDQADKYILADERLTAAGLANYEVSNWAAPGEECRHNLLYWQQREYLGIGSAAHGHTAARRWWNVRQPARYIERIERGLSPEAGAEQLDPVRRAEERFALALRTSVGAIIARGPELDATVAGLVADGLVETRPPDLVTLTRRGRLLANDVTTRLWLAGAAAAPPGPPVAVSTQYT